MEYKILTLNFVEFCNTLKEISIYPFLVANPDKVIDDIRNNIELEQKVYKFMLENLDDCLLDGIERISLKQPILKNDISQNIIRILPSFKSDFPKYARNTYYTKLVQAIYNNYSTQNELFITISNDFYDTIHDLYTGEITAEDVIQHFAHEDIEPEIIDFEEDLPEAEVYARKIAEYTSFWIDGFDAND